MRKMFLVLLFAGLLLAACSSGQPIVGIEVTELSLGNVVNGDVIVRELQVSNNGDADLVVNEITTSCSCTKATLSQMEIPPGESGLLRIEFDSGFHGPDLNGQLVRQVFIKTNDPQQPEARVELSAFVDG
jgi:hypothetical protein